MADRQVRVRLRAEVADFKRSMAEAGKSVDKMSAQFDASGQKIQTISGRMVRSADINREAWNSTGLVLAGVAAGFAAVATSVARTGIEYNTLQQTSRAALSTMLGGAQAANEQMDKLDEWAKSSPFAKQVFIDAQRQMLGFGIEAEKVIPYLDAIQNATAAMGGSNEQISSITEVLSKIASQGKITARELMQLGIHGIDAATLIGSQMDMTGAQIRESITAGSIDAMTALDALTAGMQERFGGAAENVKNTYEGALDRVKAAWRDLSSDLMEPLVSAEGGGMLVDLANWAADAMRWFQALPEPVKGTVAALTGLTGVTAGAGAAFLLLFPRIMDTIAGMRQLQKISPRAASGLGKFAKGGALVVGVVAGVQLLNAAFSSLTKQTAGIEGVTASLLDLADGVDRASTGIDGIVDFGGFKAFLTGGGSGLESMADAFEKVDSARDGLFGGIQDDLVNFTGTSNLFRGELVHARESIASVDEALAGLVQGGNTEAASDAIAALGLSSEQVASHLPAYSDALTAADNDQRQTAVSAESLAAAEERLAAVQERSTGAQEKLTDAREAFREEVDRWRTSMSDAFTGFVTNQGAYDSAVQKSTEAAQAQAQAANEASAEWARQQDGDVKTVTKTWEDFYDGVTVSARAYIDELKEQIDAQQEWAGNVESVSERLAESFTGDDLARAREELDALAAAGPASAGAVATLAGATDAELAEIVALWGQGGSDAAFEFVNAFQQSSDPFLEPRLDMKLAQMALDQWKRQEVRLQATVDFEVSDSSRTAADFDSWTGPQAPPYISAPGFRDGGPISGPGTSTSDSIPIWASDGEHMTKAAAVNFWGGRAMEHINNMDVAGLWRELGAKGFRDGGAITQTAAPQVVTFPVTQTYESHAPINVTAYASDIHGIEAEAERRRRNDLGGR